MMMTMKKEKIIYFEKAGPQNTSAVIGLMKEKALEAKPAAVVVASTSGKTGLEAARAFAGTGIRLLVVPFQKRMADKHNWHLDSDLKKQCLKSGAVFLPEEPECKMLDDERNDLIRGWYCMGQGVKVALQVATMCVDTGLIHEGTTVLSCGGTGEGADAAVLMTAFGFENAHKNRINEIIAMVQI